jgi:hypothetical protein
MSILLNAQGIRPLTTEDIPGIQVTRSDTFSLATLDRYDPGRKMLCAEYRLNKLYVFEYLLNGEIARLEVFSMDEAPSAFGMYSLGADSCRQRGTVTALSCTGPGRISIAHGTLYLNAYTIGQSSQGQRLYEQVARQFVAANPQDSWFFPAIFKLSQLSPYTRTIKFTAGPMGLARGVPQMADMLKDMPFKCYSMLITSVNYSGILARISFPRLGMTDDFLIRAGMSLTEDPAPVMTGNGTYRSWYRINETKIIYLECSSPDLKLTDLIPEKPDMNTWSLEH